MKKNHVVVEMCHMDELHLLFLNNNISRTERSKSYSVFTLADKRPPSPSSLPPAHGEVSGAGLPIPGTVGVSGQAALGTAGPV